MNCLKIHGLTEVKNIIFIVAQIVSIITILTLSGCNAAILQSKVTQTPVVIDGNLDEWDPAKFTIVDEHKISCAATNDSLFLYLAARCSDPAKSRSIEREGITFWIDPFCDEKTNIELHYPASLYAPLNQHRGGFWDALTPDQQERALATLKELQDGILIIDKGASGSQIIRHDSAGYFAIALNFAKGALTFEIRIPFSLPKYFPGIQSLLQRDKIEFGIGRSTLPSNDFYRDRSARGGTMSTTSQQGFLPERNTGTGDADVWFSVILAKP